MTDELLYIKYTRGREIPTKDFPEKETNERKKRDERHGPRRTRRRQGDPERESPERLQKPLVLEESPCSLSGGRRRAASCGNKVFV